MKKLSINQLNTILKRFVASSDIRPVLTNANITDQHIIATDSHTLIRVNRNIVEDQFFTNETNLYHVKSKSFNTEQMKYPETDRLIYFPNHEEVTVTLEQLKRMKDIVKFSKTKVTGKTQFKQMMLFTYENKLVLSYVNELNGAAEISESYETGITVNTNLSITVSLDFLEKHLLSIITVSSVTKEKEITLLLPDNNMRIIGLKCANYEGLLVPMRTYGGERKFTKLADNQDVTIIKEEQEEKEKSVKMPIVAIEGINNRYVKEYKEINDMKTYTLKNDDEKEGYTKLYAEIDGHLFLVCNVNQFDKLIDYTTEKAREHFKNVLEKQRIDSRVISKGLFEFFGMTKEFEEAKQRIKLMQEENKIKQEMDRKARELLEQQRVLEEQKQRELELLEQEERFLNGDYISNMDFYELLQKHNITVPLKMKGWIYNKLVSVSLKNCRWYSKSNTIWEYIKQLQSVLDKQRQTA